MCMAACLNRASGAYLEADESPAAGHVWVAERMHVGVHLPLNHLHGWAGPAQDLHGAPGCRACKDTPSTMLNRCGQQPIALEYI